MTSCDVYVGAKIRQFRLAAGLTQTQLAARANIDIGDLARYEDGTKRVRADRLYEIAQVLGRRISEFFEGVEG